MWNPLTWKHALALGLSFLLVGCKKLTAEGEGSVEEEDGVEVLVIEVETEPEAKVFLLSGSDLGTRSPKVKYAGATASDWVIADSKGKATLRLPLWTGTEGEKDFQIGVWRGKEPIPFGVHTPRYDFEVSVKRPAKLEVNDGKVSCIARKCKGIIRRDLALVLDEIADGTKVTFAGGVSVVASGGKAEALPSFEGLFSGLDIDVLYGPIEGQLKLPITLEFSDGKTLKRDVFVAKSALREVLVSKLKYPERGPTLLPGESPTTKGTGALLNVGSATGTFAGRAKLPTDIDYVVLQTKAQRTQACGRYRGDGGSVAELNLELTDASLVVYERRTGKKLATRTVKAKAECPETYIKFDQLSPQDKQSHTFDQKDVEAWMIDFVANPTKAAAPASPRYGGGFDDRMF